MEARKHAGKRLNKKASTKPSRQSRPAVCDTKKLDSLMKEFIKLSATSSDLHYKAAKQVHAIMTHPDYESQGPQFPRELDEILMRVLPGMGKLTLKNMFHNFPDQASWKKMNLKEIYDATIEKMQEEKKGPKVAKPPKSKAGPLASPSTGPMPVYPPPAQSLTTPAPAIDGTELLDDALERAVDEHGRPIDSLGRPNEGGVKLRGFTIERVSSLEVENEILKEEVAHKDAEIARLQEENKKLRIRLAEFMLRE